MILLAVEAVNHRPPLRCAHDERTRATPRCVIRDERRLPAGPCPCERDPESRARRGAVRDPFAQVPHLDRQAGRLAVRALQASLYGPREAEHYRARAPKAQPQSGSALQRCARPLHRPATRPPRDEDRPNRLQNGGSDYLGPAHSGVSRPCVSSLDQAFLCRYPSVLPQKFANKFSSRAE